MAWLLATGGTVPIPARPGRIDFTPLVTVLVAMLVVRLVLGIRLRWPVVVAVAVAGTVLGFAIESWGVLLPAAIALAAAAILTAPVHRRARRGRASSA